MAYLTPMQLDGTPGTAQRNTAFARLVAIVRGPFVSLWGAVTCVDTTVLECFPEKRSDGFESAPEKRSDLFC